MQTIKELILFGAKELKEIAQRPVLEAEILLSFALQKERFYLHINFDKKVDSKNYFEYIQRRKKGYAIEYITNRVSFSQESFLFKKMF